MIAALVKYAQVRDIRSFDAAIDVYIAWGKTVDSKTDSFSHPTKVTDSRRSSRSLSSILSLSDRDRICLDLSRTFKLSQG